MSAPAPAPPTTSTTTLLARMLCVLVVLVSVMVAAILWSLGGPDLVGLLADGAPFFAASILWVCFAPLVLLVAFAVTLRTPWPWVVVAVVHLVVVTAAVVRLEHLVPGAAWIGVAGTVVLGVASAVVVLLPDARRTT